MFESNIVLLLKIKLFIEYFLLIVFFFKLAFILHRQPQFINIMFHRLVEMSFVVIRYFFLEHLPLTSQLN